MRTRFGLIIAFLIVTATIPCRADMPLTLQAAGGMGMGGGFLDTRGRSGPSWFYAADLAWRHRPGRAIVLSFEGMVGPTGASYVTWAPNTVARRNPSVEHQSMVLGMELSHSGIGVGPFLQGGLGLGRVAMGDASKGLAVSGAGGILIAPDPGPLGFVLGIRSSNVIAGHQRTHVVAMMLGITIRPR